MSKRALISVSDKTNIIEFAKGLKESGFEILSTGGTLRSIAEAGIDVTPVDEVTGFPEMLDGRVKTLHPMIHGGLLGKRSNHEHLSQMEEHGIRSIDLVAVNLYPFKETVQKPDVSHQDIIENIDIGGPSMLRSAAKNFEDVLVVTGPTDYNRVLAAITSETDTYEFRQQLAAKVFRHTASYDAMIANYFLSQTEEQYPESYTVTYEKVQDLRYGENPHQQAAFYKEPIQSRPTLATAKQLHGKELSYNNIQDTNAAIEIVKEFAEPAAVAVKHMNPCGIGIGESISTAFERAYQADPTSIFGGIVACNRPVDAATAEQLSQIFLEIVVAPSFESQALEILTQKKNIRLLELDVTSDNKQSNRLTTVDGGALIQAYDAKEVSEADLEVVTNKQPTEQEINDMLFAWKAVKHVKSNAIVLAKDSQTIGVGAGQMNRIGAAEIAIKQAGDKSEGAVLASDAFFPMPDTVEAAAKAGIKAIIQPGGSKRDQDSVDVCNQFGIAMVYTKVRHFKH
ncbi:phosphoribosylaminoimidazolecarboxamide formyltransferase : IMP cyclohydrolase (bifunctional purine biosynthesis) [Oceanobacillus iheyensis HTE831]|uniref:Bifunctional purine biosynthesis protein PurH n=1 Tax=Oceanobacillus iheyensis (strain DSM 14371 / CIP 107618 / JCM 11309 / KCTC 3954 / HTE831) TaxID=221109 RepID=PUR9_OCEIH|nr:bifunctional phosphoribosylaminoimidazolecarboxamide formyltransferase/IMP cyclohydrolase [Oceanobacillus iheyensis]Q8CXK7.1 RecName: Full=Bifunctional purine biosynthesis protein PurH; Includes: RecName: Full=Phosphoribosylaminoimidazolecarboxamide formyltransferase; AltName: Full=AICAR transformylase; Includes: RecName: Full=IMP cyclohydrolase; AltName: Full=ATIC; AltName: Full=IMP synthase; AltName: Full=Inosinicase [Oceanobacillus iheyensis HTE831]BAC12705.1 phosphoribosylaminoimidazolecar